MPRLPAAAVPAIQPGRAARSGPPRDSAAPGGRGVTTQTVGRQTPLSDNPAGQFASWPVGERPQMVNRRSFELDYEIESVGGSGIAKVELWGTRDGKPIGSGSAATTTTAARSWSPSMRRGCTVFASWSKAATACRGPPRDGDLPEVWINVDLTRPAARITAADVSQEQGEVTIRWDASDSALESRPVSLWFSPQSAGPWTPIASGLENSGSYVWRLDAHVPQQIL